MSWERHTRARSRDARARTREEGKNIFCRVGVSIVDRLARLALVFTHSFIAREARGTAGRRVERARETSSSWISCKT